MELNACGIGPSRKQNLTRKRSATMALRGRIKDECAAPAPIEPFWRTSDRNSRNPNRSRIHEDYGHLAAMTLCVRITTLSPKIWDNVAILKQYFF